MPRGGYLGEFEQMVVLAVMRLRDDAYGMAVADEIFDRTGMEVSVTSVYACLDRLERQGLVTSRLADPTPKRGGRAKRYFRLAPAGVLALDRSRRAVDSMWEGVRLDTDALG